MGNRKRERSRVGVAAIPAANVPLDGIVLKESLALLKGHPA